MNPKTFFALPPDAHYRSRILQTICLCVFVLYGYRALQAEILRWGFSAVPILFCFGGLVWAAIAYWFILLYYGLRAVLTPPANGLLFSVVIMGALFAWYTPEPPLREEAKFFFNRSR